MSDPERRKLPVAVAVRSHPTGATLRVDDKEVGRTHHTVKLHPGTHDLELEMAGYDNLRKLIVVRPLDPMKVALTMKEGMSDPEREQEARRGAASVRRWTATLITLACACLGAWQGLELSVSWTAALESALAVLSELQRLGICA